MRAGGCAVQQALAAEAAAVVRQAVALARRRGHAQVTPLHVASAMLSAAGLLRAACLRSHSHPLQCKALELCFNVALNRLPAAGPAAAIFHHHHHHQQAPPVLSNALVAAFKRAQAHQRRGAVEGQQQQQQPPVQVAASSKVDIEQLIISILDDPSVSRVMREAGFSSSQVKANVEKAVSSSSPEQHHPGTTTAISQASGGHATRRPSARPDDDAMRVLDCMASGAARCVAVVGESAAAAEAVVKAVMDKVSKGELQHRHERLKNIQFVPLSAASFRGAPREEVEARAGDLRALVRQGCAAGKGVALVLEDLAYAAEAWAAASEMRRRGGGSGGGRDDDELGQRYCPVEHAVMEVSSLASAAATGGRGQDRFWLLGFGNNQAYIKCRAGQPSLEAVWELHPVAVPDGGLALSLSCASETRHQERSRTGWPFVSGTTAGGSELTCSTEVAMATPSMPLWLRQYQDPAQRRPASCATTLQLQDWNTNCNGSAATHHTSELTLSFSSPATNSPPTSSISGGFAHNYNNTNLMMSSNNAWQFKPMQPWPNHRCDDPTASSYDHHQPLNNNANPSPESYSVSNSSDGAEQRKFTELTAENLKILCNALENRVPHHKEIVADIASSVLKCRSGVTRRTRWHQEKSTWLLFQGKDSNGKKAVAQELARLVFGSYEELTSITVAEFTRVQSDSSCGEPILKRQRSLENGHGYVQRLYRAVLDNPHRVIVIDGVDQLDYDSEISIRSAISNGRIRGGNGDEISLEDAIVLLCCEELGSRSSASSPRLKQRAIDNGSEGANGMNTEKGMESPCFALDLNACAEDGEGEEEGASDDTTILNIVDGVFVFPLTRDL